jgi:hypothetical protein
MTPRPNGLVLYRGPSMLDGRPIVLILTGLNKRSKNEKTGNGLLQTWILREDIDPIRAVNTGADYSICGGCRHRGRSVLTSKRTRNGLRKYARKNKGRSCYVRLDTAPLNIWRTFHRGRYPIVTPQEANAMIAGRIVRGGSYGDPAAIPFRVWDNLLLNLESGTAYTHQWRNFPELAAFAMASVDTESERLQAKLLGFRTFRVRAADAPIGDYEIACPASKEMNYRTTCSLCRACGGNSAKAKVDITIAVHANKKR